jgi:cytochrome c peroxidase
MHSGKFSTLRETVEFYNGGRGHAAPPELNLHLHWHIVSPDLRDHELDLLVTFLKALNDEVFTPEVPLVLPSTTTTELN